MIRSCISIKQCRLTEDDINLFTSRIIAKDSYENLPIQSIHLLVLTPVLMLITRLFSMH